MLQGRKNAFCTYPVYMVCENILIFTCNVKPHLVHMFFANSFAYEFDTKEHASFSRIMTSKRECEMHSYERYMQQLLVVFLMYMSPSSFFF